MPLTVFNAEGVPPNRRERIESAVEAGGKHLSVSYGKCCQMVAKCNIGTTVPVLYSEVR